MAKFKPLAVDNNNVLSRIDTVDIDVNDINSGTDICMCDTSGGNTIVIENEDIQTLENKVFSKNVYLGFDGTFDPNTDINLGTPLEEVTLLNNLDINDKNITNNASSNIFIDNTKRLTNTSNSISDVNGVGLRNNAIRWETPNLGVEGYVGAFNNIENSGINKNGLLIRTQNASANSLKIEARDSASLNLNNIPFQIITHDGSNLVTEVLTVYGCAPDYASCFAGKIYLNDQLTINGSGNVYGCNLYFCGDASLGSIDVLGSLNVSGNSDANAFRINGTTVITSGRAITGSSIDVSGNSDANAFRINGTTVIDNSRAITGSSIDVSGNSDANAFRINGTTVIDNSRAITGSSFSINGVEAIDTNRCGDFLSINVGNIGKTTISGNNLCSSSKICLNATNGAIELKSTQPITTTNALCVTGLIRSTECLWGQSLVINGTDVIDSSRNIGNISSLQVDNLNLNGNTLSSTSGNICINSTGTGVVYIQDNLEVSGSLVGTSVDVSGNSNANAFRINGTTVIDSNRNITVGTIDSSSINTTGEVCVGGTTRTAGYLYKGNNPTNTTCNLAFDGNFYASRVHNAVFNDIADFIEIDDQEPFEYENGKAYIRNINGCTRLSCSYNEKGIIGIVSDTYGYGLGKKVSECTQLPIAVGGFVLAYVRKDYTSGTPLTVDKDGYLTKHKLIDRILNPSNTIATYYKKEKKEEWNGIKVNNRSWVKVI
jgi:hypothetical protein